jgi:8-oxo-dGTP diphosphatase
MTRVSAKAVIVRDQHLLLISKRDADGIYYLLPGGGQEQNERLDEAVKRECREELGANVEVGELLFVRDYIGRNHEFAATDTSHQVDLMFECRISEDYEPAMGTNPDTDQIGVVWLSLHELGTSRVYPSGLGHALKSGARGYLGDIN